MAKRKIKFTVNVHYKENLVGPGTEFEIVEVSDFWADYFVKNNAAEEIAEAKASVTTGQGNQQK